MAPPPLTALDKRTRRRLLARSGLRILRTTVLLFVLYYVLPLDNLHGASAVLFFLGGGVLFVGALGWQVRAILAADYPQLRAIESVGVAIPLLVVLFSAVYFAMASNDPTTFSEPLTRGSTLYFTITVLSTTGFGDIVAKSDAARLLVSAQMLFDLVLIGIVARLIFGAARQGLERQRDPDADVPPELLTEE